MKVNTTLTSPLNVETINVETIPASPFQEYKIIEPVVVQMIEKGILEKEIEKNGLIASKSSAHMLSFTKIGDYAKGDVRILGYFTDKKLEEINKNRTKKRNYIIQYTCSFEYSYTTGSYTWSSDYQSP